MFREVEDSGGAGLDDKNEFILAASGRLRSVVPRVVLQVD
jgi:hypothetical protein